MARKFDDIMDGWIFCGHDLLLLRWERARAVAQTDADKALLERAAARLREIMGNMGAMNYVLQTNSNGYASAMLHNRWQILSSWVGGTFYIVDHTKPDLILREGGPASNTARFPSIEAAETYINAIANGDRPVIPPVPLDVKPLKDAIVLTSDTETLELPFDTEERLAEALPGEPITAKAVKIKAKAKSKAAAAPPAKKPKAPSVEKPKAKLAPKKSKAATKPMAKAPVKTSKTKAIENVANVTVKLTKAPKGVMAKVGKLLADPAPKTSKKATAKTITPPALPILEAKTYVKDGRVKVGARTEQLIMAGMGEAEILATLNREYSDKINSLSNVRWYRSKLKRDGFNPPGRTL